MGGTCDFIYLPCIYADGSALYLGHLGNVTERAGKFTYFQNMSAHKAGYRFILCLNR